MRNKEEARSPERADWMKLETDKEIFFQILHALNRFHKSDREPNTQDSRSFRRRLVKADQGQTEIFLQKFGEYEYLIFARIQSEGKSESDSWIHIDGIAMERDELRARGVKDHPAFEICCLEDLYNESCILVSGEEEDKIQSEKFQV